MTAREDNAPEQFPPMEGFPDEEPEGNANEEKELPDEPATPSGDTVLEAYMRRLRHYPKLKRDEEQALYIRYRQGDRQSGERLITAHLRLVVKLALGMRKQSGLDTMDLIQAGNVGLLLSLDKFCPDKGVRFGYYASYWIKAYFWLAILDSVRLVKLGTTQNQRRIFFNLNRVRRQRTVQGLDSSTEILSRELKVSDQELESMEQRLAHDDQSLDQPLADEPGYNRLDMLADDRPTAEQQMSRRELSLLVRRCMHRLLPELCDKEAAVVHYRLLSSSPLTLREIGELFGVTRERMRQVENQVLKRIRHVVESEGGCPEWLSLLD